MTEIGRLYIVYSERYYEVVRYLSERLTELGIIIVNKEILGNSAEEPAEMTITIKTADMYYLSGIRSAGVVAFFCSNKDFQSLSYRNQLFEQIQEARDRDKKVIFIVDTFKNYYVPFCHSDNYSDDEIKAFFIDEKWIMAEDGFNNHSMINVSSEIYHCLYNSSERRILYNKLSQLVQLKFDLGIIETQCQILTLLCDDVFGEISSQNNKRTLYKEILNIMTDMESYYGEFSDEGRRIARYQISTVDKVYSLIDSTDFESPDLYMVAWACSIIYLYALIKHEAVEVCTNDDVHLLRDSSFKDRLIASQKKFFELYKNERDMPEFEKTLGQYPIDEQSLIRQVEDLQIELLYCESHGSVYRCRSDGIYISPARIKQPASSATSKEREMLLSISDLMNQSMKLFSDIGNNGKAAEFLRCLKTSYERLKNYTEIIGDLPIAAECISQIALIQHKLESISEDIQKDDIAEHGLKALLGLRRTVTGDYDVFISYKHDDQDIALSCYHYLKEKHIDPFLDSVILPELSNSDYEEAIMDSLDNSRNFLVILTDLGQLSSHWIHLEMKTFEHEISEGRKDGANFILLVSKAVNDEIIRTNKKCIPIQYRSFEIMLINSYRGRVEKYFLNNV